MEISLHGTVHLDFLVCKGKILVCQSLYKILIIISDKCAQDETGGILFLFNVCTAKKQERKPEVSSCVDL